MRMLVFCLTVLWTKVASQCTLSIDVPDDITMCEPGVVQLDGSVNDAFISFAWTGDNGFFDDVNLSSSDFPTSTTTYTLAATTEDDVSIIVNGDFESGNTGFTTNYQYSDPPVTCGNGNHAFGPLGCEGTYLIVDNSGPTHANFASCTDHTTGNGNFMAINGANALQDVWCQTVSVIPNQDYVFRAWVTSIEGSSPAILQFAIDGVLIGSDFNASGTTCVWEEFYAVWNSGASSSVEICITNQNFASGGNDFGIDDIFFGLLCEDEESFTVTIPIIDIAIDPPPILDCDQTSVDLNTFTSVVGNLYYDWDTADGVISGSTTSTSITVSSPGTYLVTVTDDSGCTAETFVIVDGSTGPPTGFVINADALTCTTSTIEATAIVDNPNTLIDWSPLGTATSPSTAIYASAGVHYAALEGDNGCVDTIFFEVIDNRSPPAIMPLLPDTLGCITDTVTVAVQIGSTYDSIAWSQGGTALELEVTEEGTYSYTVYYDQGCTHTDSILVIAATDTLAYTIPRPDTLTCATTAVALRVDVDSSAVATWSYNSGILDNDVTAVQPGTYVVQLTSAAGCTYTDSVEIISDVGLPDYVLSTDTIDCIEQRGFSAASGGPGTAFYWQGDGIDVVADTVYVSNADTLTLVATGVNGCSDTTEVPIVADINFPQVNTTVRNINCLTPVGLISATTSLPGTLVQISSTSLGLSGLDSLAISMAGTYDVVATSPQGCISASTVTVTVDTVPPSATLEYIPTLTCTTRSIDISALITTPYANASWSGAGLQVLGDDQASTDTPGMYTYTLTGANGCEYSESISIEQDTAAPTLPPIMDGLLDCDTRTISRSVAGIGATVEWYDEMGGLVATSTDLDLSSAGLYTVTAIDPSNGCSDSTTFVITIDTATLQLDIAADTITCNTPSATITVSGTGPYTYVDLSPDLSRSAEGLSTSIPGSYQITAMGDNGCLSTSNVLVRIDTLSPAVTIADGSLDCVIREVTLVAVFDTIANTYSWSSSTGSLPTVASPVVRVADTYSLEVTSRSSGCTTRVQATVAELSADIDLAPEIAQPPCDDLSGQLRSIDITGGTAPYDVLVTAADGLIYNQAEALPPSSYLIAVTDANGCTASQSFTIEDRPALDIDLGPDLELSYGSDTIINLNLRTDAALVDLIDWSPDSLLTCDNCRSPSTVPMLSDHTIQVTVTDIYGCSASDMLTIRVSRDIDFIAPNIINANSNRGNSRFTIYTTDPLQVRDIDRLLIYDRWGNLVYEGTMLPISDNSQGWDGSMHGQPAAEGVYVYIGAIALVDGQIIQVVGDVTLTR